MFFKTWKPQMPTLDDFDLQAAKTLATALYKNNKVQRQFKLAYWAQFFCRLRRDVEPDNIIKVLNWYCSNIKRPYTPQAYSGKSFWEKFDQIERAMIRAVGEEVAVSDEARKITERLQNLYWPKINEDELAQAVQLSLDNYTSFLTHDTKLFPPAIRNKLSAPATFTEQWFRDVNNQIRDWDDWSGNIKKQAFYPEHKRFRARGRSWANEYCGDPNRWDQLMEKINGL